MLNVCCTVTGEEAHTRIHQQSSLIFVDAVQLLFLLRTHDYFLSAWLNTEHSVPQCNVTVVSVGLVGLVLLAS